MNFTEKVVLVTGGGAGIGAAIAIKFAANGAKVAIVDINEAKLKNVSEECERVGSKPLVIVADVSKDEDAKRIMSTTIAHFKKLNVLVNNAGIGGTTSILSGEVMKVFDKVMATNFRSAVYITHLAAPHLVETKGNIINISSVAAVKMISKESFAYCSSKASLNHFGRCIALELAPKGVRVNSINPGPVKTDIIQNMGAPPSYAQDFWDRIKKSTALDRVSDPEEIADLALFLASDQARSITGSDFTADNGSCLIGIMDN